MIKILIITPFTPDNQGVGASYTSQLLLELSRDCLIDLVYFRYEEEASYVPCNSNIKIVKEKTINKVDKLKAICLNPMIFPLFSTRYNRDIIKYLNKHATKANYDYIYLDFSQTFLYAKYINHPNIILMSHDIIAQKYSRMKKYLRKWAMHTEEMLLKKGTIVFTFSLKDCNLIKEYYNIGSLSTTFFLNKNVLNAVPSYNSNYFVFFGNWSRQENCEGLEWFIKEVLDFVPKNTQFKIIGGGLPKKIREKVQLLKNIDYLGYVDNPYPIIANAIAEIAPLFKGAGVKVKCIEALGCGTPIIGTEIAFEGIGNEYSEFFTCANSAKDFINIISNFQFNLSEKKELKNLFLKLYNHKTILKYLRK